MTQKIGFIGIGMMGHGMAKNLLAKGFPLTFKVNRNRDNLADLIAAGAKEATSNAACAQASPTYSTIPAFRDIILDQTGDCQEWILSQ